MADVKWIKMKVGMFDGMSFKKIKKAKIGGESFRDKLTAIWFELMDFAGRCNQDGAFISPREIPFTELSDIATMIDREEEELQLCMGFYLKEGMVTITDDVYSIANWSEYQNTEGLEKIREQTRKRVARHRENQKLLSCNDTCSVTVTHSNALDKDKDKDKDINNNMSIANALFEELWSLYPRKKGKGQISDAKKKKLVEVGKEQMIRAIERYKRYVASQKELSYQYGSTFFNSGYIDYLDENYTEDEHVVKTSSNKFVNFSGRQYSKEQMQSMEKLLVQKSINK